MNGVHGECAAIQPMSDNEIDKMRLPYADDSIMRLIVTIDALKALAAAEPIVDHAERLKRIARERIYIADVGDGHSVRGQLGGHMNPPGSPGWIIFGVGTEMACRARRTMVLAVVDQIIDAAYPLSAPAVCGGCGKPMGEHPPGPPCPPKSMVQPWG